MVFFLLNFTRDSILGPLGLLSLSHSFLFEIIDMLIMAFAIGYIFSDFLKKPAPDNYDPLVHHKKNATWENVKFAALAAGPAVVVHELLHKFVAMAFGAEAILYAPYGFYLLIVILKAIGFPFLFFVGGFVAHSPLPALPSFLVAIAGPLANFLMWGIAAYLLKKKKVKGNTLALLVPFARINLFLGIFNLIPLPGFDGYHALTSLLSLF